MTKIGFTDTHVSKHSHISACSHWLQRSPTSQWSSRPIGSGLWPPKMMVLFIKKRTVVMWKKVEALHLKIFVVKMNDAKMLDNYSKLSNIIYSDYEEQNLSPLVRQKRRSITLLLPPLKSLVKRKCKTTPSFNDTTQIFHTCFL